MAEKSKNSGKNSGIANLTPFKKGVSGNPNGRPKGRKDYATLRAEAITAIGKKLGKTPQEIEIMLHERGISEALKGNFQFYKDDLDRTFGKDPIYVNIKVGIVQLVKQLEEDESF